MRPGPIPIEYTELTAADLNQRLHTSGADPGFPIGGGANPPGGANI